jgi:hypothetical protein
MATINTATYKPRIKRGSRQHVYHIESATHRNTFYTTDAYNMTCTCPAGRKGKRCWHLATAISYDAWRKAPCQPLGATTVILEPDLGTDHTGLLALLEAAIERLLVYRADYADALAADALSTTERTF